MLLFFGLAIYIEGGVLIESVLRQSGSGLAF